MSLDHSEALVRMIFDGVMVFRFNDKTGLCELGLIDEPRHKTHMKITAIDGGGHSVDVPLGPVNKYKNIWIDAINPVRKGVSKYQAKNKCQRKYNKGDAEDFGWIVDLENKKEFHKSKLIMIPEGLKSTLFISTGMFHSYIKTIEYYGRRTTKGGSASPFYLGKLAHNLGIDIVCDKQKGRVELKNEGGKPLPLTRHYPEHSDRLVRYEIEVGNYCDDSVKLRRAKRDSDFSLVYRAVKDPDGIEFDLDLAVERGDRRWKKNYSYANMPGWAKDGEPQVCNQYFIGSHGSLSG